MKDCRKEMLNPCPCTSQTCDIYSGQIGERKASRVLNEMLWKDELGLPRARLQHPGPPLAGEQLPGVSEDVCT